MTAAAADVRTFLTSRVATIDGLNAYPVIPANFVTPCAYLELLEVLWDETFDGEGTFDKYTWKLTVVVSIASWIDGQENLDAYVDSTGSQSIKSTLEADDTYTTRVESTGPQEVIEADTLAFCSQAYIITVWA